VAVLRHSLVLGGTRSGKSVFAETLALSSGLAPVYIATAEPFDQEMRRRIEEHRARRGPAWTTVEAPRLLLDALLTQSAADRVLLVDCLTLWLTNLLLADLDLTSETDRLVQSSTGWRGPVILVSNEVGLGGIAADPISRTFADHAGRLHQALAAVLHEVVLVTAGLPIWLKR
jgi:adenosylcobinamide kinase / adenosylcobinamide-phosphate guanylyltransferase